MREHRNLRLVSVLTITAALTFSVFASAALAGTPAGWSASAVASPAKVSANDTAGFKVTFTNSGPSNISKLFLVASAAGFVEASPSQGQCNPTGPLWCSLGAVNAGTTVNVTVVYATGTANKSVDFEFNTTGVAADKNNKSHGDALKVVPTTTALVSTSNRDFAGRFIGTNGNQTVLDDPKLTNKNQHSTQVNAPEDFIPVTVEERLAGAFECPSTVEGFDPSSCFGQWSVVNVNNGSVYTQGFTILVGLSHFEIPQGVDETNLNFVHLNDDGTFDRLIDQDCDFSNGSGNPPTNMPCKVVTPSGNDLLGLLWVIENGPYRGY
jgi:hypothetical protein